MLRLAHQNAQSLPALFLKTIWSFDKGGVKAFVDETFGKRDYFCPRLMLCIKGGMA